MSLFSERLTNLREANSWSKTYVAKQIGLSSMQTYANWEYGRTEPDFSNVTKLADLFAVTTDYLLGRPENEKTANDQSLTENQKLVAYSIDPDITDEERKDIIELVKIAMKNRRRI